jgi:hypothetical protein
VGQSAIWDARGRLVAKVDGEGEGIVLADTATSDAAVVRIP